MWLTWMRNVYNYLTMLSVTECLSSNDLFIANNEYNEGILF
jgi:hypothetical protein